MSDHLPAVLASVRLARQALVRLHALAEAGVAPEPVAFAEAVAHLDDALKALEAVETERPLRVLPGGRGRHGRR